MCGKWDVFLSFLQYTFQNSPVHRMRDHITAAVRIIPQHSWRPLLLNNASLIKLGAQPKSHPNNVLKTNHFAWGSNFIRVMHHGCWEDICLTHGWWGSDKPLCIPDMEYLLIYLLPHQFPPHLTSRLADGQGPRWCEQGCFRFFVMNIFTPYNILPKVILNSVSGFILHENPEQIYIFVLFNDHALKLFLKRLTLLLWSE